MNKSLQYNQQTEPKQSLNLRKYVFAKPGKWPSQHLYLKIDSEFHARKNPKQQYLKVVTFNNASFSQKRIHVYDHAA